jgi:hypothetical protein
MDSYTIWKGLCIYIATRVTYLFKRGGCEQDAGWQPETNACSLRVNDANDVANLDRPHPPHSTTTRPLFTPLAYTADVTSSRPPLQSSCIDKFSMIPVVCATPMSTSLAGSLSARLLEGFIVSPPSTKIVLLILHIEVAGGGLPALGGVMVLAKSRHENATSYSEDKTLNYKGKSSLSTLLTLFPQGINYQDAFLLYTCGFFSSRWGSCVVRTRGRCR